MTIESMAYTYTSQAEVERLYSVLGALDRADDDYDGAAEEYVWDDIINEATDTINLYVSMWYDPALLQNNLWVRRAATVIAAYFLSQRRANPAQFEERYDRLIKTLEKIMSGEMVIPRMPMRADLTPGMSNYTIQDHFRVAKIRVEPQISTGGHSQARHVAFGTIYDPWS